MAYESILQQHFSFIAHFSAEAASSDVGWCVGHVSHLINLRVKNNAAALHSLIEWLIKNTPIPYPVNAGLDRDPL
jgi:hypothetical protein